MRRAIGAHGVRPRVEADLPDPNPWTRGAPPTEPATWRNPLTTATTSSTVATMSLGGDKTVETDFDRRVAAVRRFNRFYTQRIGVLEDGYLDSPFSLAEVRVLFELAHRRQTTAGELARDLGLDPGYLSRILRRFSRRGFVAVSPVPHDRRQRLLSLTARGSDAFAPLNARSRDDIGALLAPVPDGQQRRLVDAMRTIERLFGSDDAERPPVVIRPHQNGDMGWIVHRHGALYAQEFGYDEHFEALVAEVVAAFLRHHDPKRERCWIAEQDGEIVGSLLLVRHSEDTAKLRLLLVEPAARGQGIGSRLIAACIRFARSVNYRTITLWTQSELLAARRVYEQAGFHRVAEEPHCSFGHDLIAETWELTL